MQPEPATDTGRFKERLRAARRAAGLTQAQAVTRIQAGGFDMHIRTLGNYEAGKTEPSERDQAFILRLLLGAVRPSPAMPPGYLTPADRPDGSAPGGAAGGASSPAALRERGVEPVASRVVTECHDEGGLMFAIELRMWVRPEPRTLGMSTRTDDDA